jgi:hypothetical protein
MTNSQSSVLDVLDIYGPMSDQALVPLAQHMGEVHQSSSGIRSRRAELTRMGLVQKVGTVTLPSGRSAAVWAVKG